MIYRGGAAVGGNGPCPRKAMTDKGRQELDEAYAGLEKEVPDRVARALRWLRDPRSRWIRLPLGLALIALSSLWFLPIIGLEWAVVGLLLIAQDVPFLRVPAARVMLWVEDLWRVFRRWWSKQRKRRFGR